MAKSRKDKLGMLSMPKNKMAEEEAMMDLDMLDMPEEELASEDMPEEEMEMANEEMGMLEDISDDDLIAEIQKRGLELPEEEMMAEDEEADLEEELSLRS